MRRSRSLALSILVLSLVISIFLLAPRSQAINSPQDPPAPPRTTLGVGYGGQAAGNRVVKWERKGNRILLRNVLYDVIADPKLPVSRAVQAANNNTIIMSFNIEALGKDEAAVIDVTRLFTSEVTEFSARTRLRARGFDASRSFIEKTKSFPTNIEVEVSQTYTSPPDMSPAGGGGGPQPIPNPFAQGMRAGTNAT
jgi:hypothetical protein